MSETMETAEQTNNGEVTSEETEQSTVDEQSQTEQGEQQEQQEQQKPEGAPETYEFKAPEGKEYDSEFIKVYSETVKGVNLTQEQAQQILEKMNPVLEARQAERIEAVRNEWAENSKVDKEFGGEKLNENLAIAKTALDKFGTPELKELINKSGFGNHPELIRFFYRAGKSLSQDTFVAGSNGGGNKSGPVTMNDLADKLYKN